jgi:hypothetical protein
MTLRGVWTKPWTKFENKKLFSNYRPPFAHTSSTAVIFMQQYYFLEKIF